MRACILDSQTKVVKNVIIFPGSPEEFIPYEPGTELAPREDGEIGFVWNGSGWDVPTQSLEEIERQNRDDYLKLYIDIMNAVRWDSLSQEKKNEFIAYRQALLDVPQQPGFPTNIDWPTPPQI